MLLESVLMSTAIVLSCFFELCRAWNSVTVPNNSHWCEAILCLGSPVPKSAMCQTCASVREQARMCKDAIKKSMFRSGSQSILFEVETDQLRQVPRSFMTTHVWQRKTCMWRSLFWQCSAMKPFFWKLWMGKVPLTGARQTRSSLQLYKATREFSYHLKPYCYCTIQLGGKYFLSEGPPDWAHLHDKDPVCSSFQLLLEFGGKLMEEKGL